jgi:hypothetical protein
MFRRVSTLRTYALRSNASLNGGQLAVAVAVAKDTSRTIATWSNDGRIDRLIGVRSLSLSFSLKAAGGSVECG